MFTMILSVVVYNHKLTIGQWLGTAIVFAGISIEAFVKRKGILLVSLLTSTYGHCRCACEAGCAGEGKGQDQVIVVEELHSHRTPHTPIENLSIFTAQVDNSTHLYSIIIIPPNNATMQCQGPVAIIASSPSSSSPSTSTLLRSSIL